MQRQPRFMVDDRRRVRNDETGETAGRDDRRLTEFSDKSGDEAIDERRIAKDRPRLHCLNRGTSDCLFRNDEFNAS